MVYHRLDAVFSALADPTRRKLVHRLATRERSISELARPFRMSLPAVSKHLRVLERAGLVSRRRDGRQWTCRLTPQPMRAAAGWLDEYRNMWDDQLDRLAAYLESSNAEPEDTSCLPPPVPARSPSPGSSTRGGSASSRRGRRRKR
ncbi:MAG TPA: metalloregulator ArsR/SmtB family transcription factor [Gemmatimonadales bacterium]|jgi:DNA-binding transcriptional ArsR family regulator